MQRNSGWFAKRLFMYDETLDNATFLVRVYPDKTHWPQRIYADRIMLPRRDTHALPRFAYLIRIKLKPKVATVPSSDPSGHLLPGGEKVCIARPRTI